MNENGVMNDFILKFKELNEINQKYIVAVQQALYYAQTTEGTTKENNNQKKGISHEAGII